MRRHLTVWIGRPCGNYNDTMEYLPSLRPWLRAIMKNELQSSTQRAVFQTFQVQTGVQQGCILSPFLFLLVIDWIMKMTTKQRRNWNPVDIMVPVRWPGFCRWAGLTFLQLSANVGKVDQLAFTSRRPKSWKWIQPALNLSCWKVCVVWTLEGVESFTYVPRQYHQCIGQYGWRIGKTRTAFLQLQTIWKSRELSQRTKIRIFNSNVNSVLLYVAETWRITKPTATKAQTFINSCLWRIRRVHWSGKFSNISLWEKTQQIPAEWEM